MIRRERTTPTPAPRLPRLGLAAEVRRAGTPLLNQQCWCWGYDIRRPAGNLLLAHGFARQRPPAEARGSSAYTLRLPGEQAVVLWGFGLFYGAPSLGGLYLARAAFGPRLLDDHAPPATVWSWEQLEAARPPVTPVDWWRAYRLMALACAWIAGYERWVIATCGLAYRQASLAAWRKSPTTAAAMAEAWTALARCCEQRAERLAAALPSIPYPEVFHDHDS